MPPGNVLKVSSPSKFSGMGYPKTSMFFIKEARLLAFLGMNPSPLLSSVVFYLSS